MNEIRSFTSAGGGQPIIMLTVVGSSIPDFLREHTNQGLKPTDTPLLGLDMVEADLEDTLSSGKRHQARCAAAGSTPAPIQ